MMLKLKYLKNFILYTFFIKEHFNINIIIFKNKAKMMKL